MIIAIDAQAVEYLSKIEKDGLREIEQSKNNIEEQINELQLISKTLSADFEAKLEISFFKLVERNNLQRFERTLPNTDYSLSDFQPDDTRRVLQDNFGIRPNLQRSGYGGSLRNWPTTFHASREFFPRLDSNATDQHA